MIGTGVLQSLKIFAFYREFICYLCGYSRYNERNGCDDRDDCDARALGLAVDMGVTRLSGAKDIRMVCYIASITQQPLRRFASSRRVCSQRSTVKYG